ncbi:MAG: hypothetical protein L6Q55_01010 [Azonexus sp.]|nr:hypothetical protein [Azonexus sp.]MCK6410988.1 hypothetical protein [Azonexus sp.]
MADEDLKVRILSAVASTNAGVRRIQLQANPLRHVADSIGFGESYRRLQGLTDSSRYDFAAARVVADYARAQLSARVGLEIEEISEAGLARAIGKRAGFDLNSLSDVEQIKRDLLIAAVIFMASRLGWVVEEAIDTVEKLARLLERKVAAYLEGRFKGLQLHDLFDPEQTKKDVLRYVCLLIRMKTGINVRNVDDIDAFKKELLDWADAEVRRRLGIRGTGGGLRMTAAAIRSRRAQRVFYAKHGNLKIYQPVGQQDALPP